MSENVLVVTDDSFANDVLQSDIPVIVDFWAEWCGPCKMIAPVFEAVAAEFVGKVKFVKLNVDQNTKVPTTYDIRGIPSLILFKNGKTAAVKVGALTRAQLIDFVNANV